MSTPLPSPAEPPQDRALRWPMALGGLIVLSLLGHGSMVYVAVHDPNFRVEKDYYRKGLHWDEHQEQAIHNLELGWKVDLELTRQGDAVQVAVKLADPVGKPISGACVTLRAFHNAHANHELRADLEPAGEPGTYLARLPIERSGLWTFRCTVERGQDRFTCQLRQDVEG